MTEEMNSTLSLNNEKLVIEYHDKSFLLIAYETNESFITNQDVNLCVMDESNQNLTPSQFFCDIGTIDWT